MPTVTAAIDFYTPECKPIIAEAVRRSIEQGETFDLQLQIITAKNEWRWVHAIGESYKKLGQTVAVGGTFQDIIAQGEDRFESRHRRKDGSIFDVEVSVQARPDEDGQMVAFLHDISERKRTEASQEKLEAQLRQAAKMESVGRLAGGVAPVAGQGGSSADRPDSDKSLCQRPECRHGCRPGNTRDKLYNP
jgi:PAS domain-containing protein